MAAIDVVMQQIMAGWKSGDGRTLAAPFAERARFIAWDGQVLEGREAIAAHHQRAFEGPLRGTMMRIQIDEVRSLAEGLSVVFTTGAVAKDEATAAARAADSRQMFVCRMEGDGAVVEAFQNTRLRPITDGVSAGVWREFEQMWERRNG